MCARKSSCVISGPLKFPELCNSDFFHRRPSRSSSPSLASVPVPTERTTSTWGPACPTSGSLWSTVPGSTRPGPRTTTGRSWRPGTRCPSTSLWQRTRSRLTKSISKKATESSSSFQMKKALVRNFRDKNARSIVERLVKSFKINFCDLLSTKSSAENSNALHTCLRRLEVSKAFYTFTSLVHSESSSGIHSSSLKSSLEMSSSSSESSLMKELS